MTFDKGINQRDRLLTYLQRAGSISSPTAQRELGIEALPARILELKKIGHDIRTEIVQITAVNGSKKRMAVYRLLSE